MMAKGVYFPRVLLEEPRFFNLPAPSQHFIIRLYFAADPWGRLPGSPRAIAQHTWFDQAFVADTLPTLLAGERPFAIAYEADGAPYLQLNQYDQHMERTFLSNRPRPKHPDPPQQVFERAGCLELCRKPDGVPYRPAGEETSAQHTARDRRRGGLGPVSGHRDDAAPATRTLKKEKEHQTNHTPLNPDDTKSAGVSGSSEGLSDEADDSRAARAQAEAEVIPCLE
jgi:hypothetical protein